MSKLEGLTVAIAVLAAALPATAQSTAPADLADARARFNTAIETFDVQGAGTWFTDSAVVDFGGEIFTGRRAITEAWLPTVFADLASIAIGNATFRAEGSDMLETSAHTVGTPDGPQYGTHTVLWRRTDRGWRIVRLVVLAG